MRSTVVALCVLLAASSASARRSPLPEAERTPGAVLWLARAWVGEAGWLAARDHAGIGWVLARRWRRAVKRWPELRFVTVVQNYAHALGFRSGRSLTPRQHWLRGLSGAQEPVGWPRRASWRRHRPFWRATLERAAAWFDGRVKDPCQGRAWHWGGEIDVEGAREKGLVEVDCGETENIFYGGSADDAQGVDHAADGEAFLND